MSISHRFKQLVEALKINANQLAKELNVTRPTITRVINGTNEPSAKILAPLLRKYPTVNVKWLLIGEGEMFIPENPVAKDYLDRLAASLERENDLLRNRVDMLAAELEDIRREVESMPDDD